MLELEDAATAQVGTKSVYCADDFVQFRRSPVLLHRDAASGRTTQLYVALVRRAMRRALPTAPSRGGTVTVLYEEEEGGGSKAPPVQLSVRHGHTWAELVGCMALIPGSTPFDVTLTCTRSRNLSRWAFGGFLLEGEDTLRCSWKTDRDSIMMGLLRRESDLKDSYASLTTMFNTLQRRAHQQERELERLENEVRDHKRARGDQASIWRSFMATAHSVLAEAAEEAEQAGGAAGGTAVAGAAGRLIDGSD